MKSDSSFVLNLQWVGVGPMPALGNLEIGYCGGSKCCSLRS